MAHFEYKVVEEMFGKPSDTEVELNKYADAGWEFYSSITLGPIPSRWLIFRREKTG